jgi:RTA1 like protein
MLESRSGVGALSTFKYYRYDPSIAAAVIFIVAFSLSTCLHLYQLIRTRTWFFISFFIGGVFESIGYVGRAVSSTQTPDWTLGPYIIQSLLLLVAPALFAASIYMVLGRIVEMTQGDKHLFVRRTWMTKIFVCGDVLSFLMQGAGRSSTAATVC